MPPTIPINHYGGPRNQQNRTKRPILLFHANIFEQYACFEHSNFFTVNDLGPRDPPPAIADRRWTPCDVPTNSIAGTGIQKEGTGGPVDTLML